MITVEDLLEAFELAYDEWLDPETALLDPERKNPTAEYADLIRRAVSAENDKLRELCAELLRNAQVAANVGVNIGKLTGWERRAGELGVEEGE